MFFHSVKNSKRLNNRGKITGSKHHQFRKADDRSETGRSLMITGRDILLCVTMIFGGGGGGSLEKFSRARCITYVAASPVIVNHDALDAV